MDERLTDDDYDKLEEVSNAYWHDFSDLVNATLRKVRPNMRELLKETLQERSSVYGRRTTERKKPKKFRE